MDIFNHNMVHFVSLKKKNALPVKDKHQHVAIPDKNTRGI